MFDIAFVRHESSKRSLHISLDGPIDFTTHCRAAIVTRKPFLTCNIYHTKRFSDSREKRDAAGKKQETSREKQDSSREKQDERW